VNTIVFGFMNQYSLRIPARRIPTMVDGWMDRFSS